MTKHEQEAIAVGLLLVGKSDSGNPNYRKYRCKEGHEFDAQIQHVRRNNWTCKECFEARLAKEAYAIGYELLGSSDKGAAFRKYKKDCGCIDDIRFINVRAAAGRDQVICKTCLNKRRKESADNCDIEILDNVDTYNVNIRFKSCGHIKVTPKQQLLRENIVCRECEEDRFKQEAIAEGLTLLGKCGKGDTRLYRLPCGCESEISMSAVRLSSWQCRNCSISHYSKECYLYHLVLFSNGLPFIKIGIANNVERRVSGYGCTDINAIFKLGTVLFKTKYDALSVEKELHRKYHSFKLPVSVTKNYMASGFTECYPMSMQQVFIDEFNNLRRENAG